MLDPEHLKNLQLLGLNTNQSKIYLSLVSEVSLSIRELVEKTNIPRTKIYIELQSLKEKNWIYRQEGRPILYSAISPNKIYQKESGKLFHNLNETENHLKTQWEEREKFQTQTISVINGEHYLMKETLDGISAAKKMIVLTLRFIFPDEIKSLINALQIQKKKGVSIKLVIFPELYQNFDEELKKTLKKLNPVKLGPVPMRALLVDDDFALLSFLSAYDKIQNTETIKITYSGFVELLRNSFNITFENFVNP